MHITLKHAAGVVVLASIATVCGITVATAQSQLPFAYPKAGQSQQQTMKDSHECQAWSQQQTNFNPQQAEINMLRQQQADQQQVAQAQQQQQAAASRQGGVLRGAGRGAALGAVGGAIGGMPARAPRSALVSARSAAACAGARHRETRRPSRNRCRRRFNSSRRGNRRSFSNNSVPITAPMPLAWEGVITRCNSIGR